MKKILKPCLVILLVSCIFSGIFVEAYAGTVADHSTYFAEERFFPDPPTVFFRNSSETLFGDYSLMRGAELSGWKNSGAEIEADKLYLVDGEKRAVIKKFSDISVTETNMYQPPYSVQDDGVYVLSNKSSLLKVSKDGEILKTVFGADNGKTIKDFLIVEDLAWIFSDGVISRVYLPDGTVESVLCGIDENRFCQFLSPISNIKVAWSEYAPAYWANSDHSDIPTFILYYCDLLTRENSQAPFFAARQEDEKNTDWWRSSENIGAKAYLFLGDANRDGSVDAEDARLALRKSVDLEHLSEAGKYYADYDNDGVITSADARMILRSSVLLESPIVKKRSDNESKSLLPADKNEWPSFFSNSISYDDVENNMKWLVEEMGVRSWWDSTQNKAADLIYEKLRDYGYPASYCKKTEFSTGGILGENVMATIPTAVKNPKILLVMSHYDTARGTGGAVDNASGAAALLQLAKEFKLTEQDFGIELRFLFTAGEEQGYYGAYAYVDSLSAAEKNRHIFTFNMDMAGKPNKAYDPTGKYCLTVSTEPLSTDGYKAPAAKENIGSIAVDKTKQALGNLGEYAYYSPVRAGIHDIIPFRKAGMDALTLSWRCISSERGDGSDHNLVAPDIIHTQSDNIKNFDMMSLYQTTRLAAGAIARLMLPYKDL